MNLHAMHTSINFLGCDLESPNYRFIRKSKNIKFQTKNNRFYINKFQFDK
jgi:hypothetical protein